MIFQSSKKFKQKEKSKFSIDDGERARLKILEGGESLDFFLVIFPASTLRNLKKQEITPILKYI